MTDEEKKRIRQDFDEAVNMTPSELERWLKTDKSKEVGWTHEGEDESVGHKAGSQIVEIKHKKAGDLADGDFAHMKKVVGYVNRHSKQRPKGDVTDTRWRYSLMNWGHDPLKD